MEGPACADIGARTPIGVSENFQINFLCISADSISTLHFLRDTFPPQITLFLPEIEYSALLAYVRLGLAWFSLY